MQKLAILILFVLTAVVLLNLNVASAETRQIRIGFVIPLSGDWAFLGQGIKNGALLANEDLPLAEKPELIFEDNQGEISSSVTSANRLVNIKKVDAIISIISGVAQAIRPITERRNVISVGICSDTGAADGKLAFINYLTAEDSTEAYLDHLTDVETKPISISIIQLTDTGFERIVQNLKKVGPSRGVRIDAIESYDRGVTDFRSLLLRVSRKKSSTVLLLGLSPEIELIAKQNQDANQGLKFSSIESFGLVADKSPFNGSWYVDSAYPTDEFVIRYKGQFGSDMTAGAGHSYETVRLLSKSHYFKKPISSFNNSKEAEGILGRLSVGEDGVISTAPSIKIIRNGNAERIK